MLEPKHGGDRTLAQEAQHKLSERMKIIQSGRSWGSSDLGSRRQHSRHSLRFEWPSRSANESPTRETDGSISRTRSKRIRALIATPLDPAVYILTAAYMTLDKEEELRSAKPSAVAGLFEKGARWTGEIRDWWNKKVGA